MLIIDGNKIKKYFGDRLILNIDSIKIYSEDRIGIVGPNGVGKTTLINILSKRLEPDAGSVTLHGSCSFVSQLEDEVHQELSPEMASKFGIPCRWNAHMSGGEKTRFKLALALSKEHPILFADEPTSNLDMDGIELVEEQLQGYRGTLILISHDRSLLNACTNRIFELHEGRINIYHGNYEDYTRQKAHEMEREQFEYDQYLKEKRRLEGIIQQTKQRAGSIKGPPRRMGNSEARLHKMGGQKAKATLERAAKNVQKRLDHLEEKEKPRELERIKLDLVDMGTVYSRMVIWGEDIHKSFGEKVIFKGAEFKIYNGSKVALIGPNGSGKSTLVKMILDREDPIRVAKGVRIGYFSQDLSILDESLSILENVMVTSIYSETFVRTLLARLLFKGDQVHKAVRVLSGGERVKVSFAKIVVQDINMLILDEPTNYMDINSIEVMEEVLKGYQGTLLLVTHDRSFIEGIADHIMTIQDHRIQMYLGTYKDYLEKWNKPRDDEKKELEQRIFVLQNRLTEVTGRLSIPPKDDDMEELDREYHRILRELKELKGNLEEV